MEADRLKMCGMMWLKEHETCLAMDVVHCATGETVRQLNEECFHVTKDFHCLCRQFDSLQAAYTNVWTWKNDAAAVKHALE